MRGPLTTTESINIYIYSNDATVAATAAIAAAAAAVAAYAQNVEYDVRRDADDRGGQHEPAELAIFRRGRELRAADGADAGRARQTDGDDTRASGTAAGDGNAANRGREGTGRSESPAQRKHSSGMGSSKMSFYLRFAAIVFSIAIAAIMSLT